MGRGPSSIKCFIYALKRGGGGLSMVWPHQQRILRSLPWASQGPQPNWETELSTGTG